MDKQEAKLILASYTLDNQPTGDGRFDAALALAKSDPELSAWWDAQRATDRHIKSRLQAVEAPSDLRSALRETIAGARGHRSWFSAYRNVLAIAATIALALGLYYQYGIDRSDDYTGSLAQMAYEYSVDGPRLSYFNRDTQKLRDWLAENQFELPEQLPPKLLELDGIGCRPLKWSAERVALMCFDADTVYHLFVASKRDFPNFEASEEIDFDHYKDGWTVTQWTDRDHVFVLTAKAPTAAVSGFLASYTPGR